MFVINGGWREWAGAIIEMVRIFSPRLNIEVLEFDGVEAVERTQIVRIRSVGRIVEVVSVKIVLNCFWVYSETDSLRLVDTEGF